MHLIFVALTSVRVSECDVYARRVGTNTDQGQWHTLFRRGHPAEEQGDRENYVSISTWGDSDDWEEVEKIAPRSNEGLPMFVDLLSHVDDDGGLWIKIEWTHQFHVDDLCLYTFSTNEIKETSLDLESANHSLAGSIEQSLSVKNDALVILKPGEEIRLFFSSEVPTEYDYGVMKFSGKYEPVPQKTKEAESVSDLDSTPLLLQNYPNPFNLSTGLRFELPYAGHLTLSIYNLLGQRIKVLADQEFQAGEHSIVWDGTNDQGVLVPSGLYFCSLKFGESLISRKMVLMK